LVCTSVNKERERDRVFGFEKSSLKMVKEQKGRGRKILKWFISRVH
jgi:hypothetical protein